MEIDILNQAALFGGATALGAGAALLYDGMRLLRHRLGWRWLEHLLDGLFWLTVTAALFIYSLAFGDGRVRIFYIASSCLGAALYAFTLGRLVRTVLERLADAAAFYGVYCVLPSYGWQGS